MAVIQNETGLVSISRPQLNGLYYDSLSLYDGSAVAYDLLYKTQPELRSAIDFLARSIAQVPLHAYRRISDNERARISTGPLAATLDRPDVHATRSRWLDALVHDLSIYDTAYFVKVRGDAGRIALVRIPPSIVELVGTNWMYPEAYKVHGSAGTVEFPSDAVIYIHGYNPIDPRKGLSPIETLRRLLAEQAAAGQYREKFWQNSARMSGVIERPTNAPNWSDTARNRFRADFEATHTGAAASGRTLVLEEGMQYKATSFSARDAQYLESFQLSREVVAAAYGIPNGLLGLGSNTYASLSEQHRQLYSDCLAPWLVRIEQELELQLLPEFGIDDSVYLEFNIAAKLSGSFTEQATVLSSSVGAPYLTRNEARARLNLPPVDGGDELVTPLNVLIGGQSSPQDSVSDERLLGMLSSEPSAKKIEPDDAKAARWDRVLRVRTRATRRLRGDIEDAFERQRRSVISRLGAKSKSGVKAEAEDVFSRARFQRELAADVRPAIKQAASLFGATVGDWDVEEADDYLNSVADNFAESVIDTTIDRLDDALGQDDPEAAVDGLFDSLSEELSPLYAASLISGIGEFSRSEAARANDLSTKTWIVTSGNPRSTHAALNGETVSRGQPFSNGAMFPGDPALDVEDRANCACLVDFA